MTSTNNSMNSQQKISLSKNRKLVWMISVSLCIISVIGMFSSFINPNINSPLNLGLDYTGGTQITFERECEKQCSIINTEDISQNLNSLKKT